MKKYNIIIGITSLTILLIIAFLVYLNFFDEKITITLFGSNDIFIYENEDYYENGFLAINNKGENVNERVVISSDLDNNKIGVYEINYIVKTKFKTYTASRTIRVLEDPLKNIEFNLLGSKVVNLEIGEDYIDPLYNCVDKSTNQLLNDKVKVVNYVNNQQEGMYEIEYRLKVDGKEKILIRKVYVITKKYDYTLNVEGPINSDVIINLTSNIHNFSYIVCPNEEIVYLNNLQYQVSENGEYKFLVYNNENTFDEVLINVTNIDRVAPTGSCKGVMLDGKTTYTVLSNDLDISKYIYNNEEVHTSTLNTYVIPRFVRNSTVKLVDFANNETIHQTVEVELTPVTKGMIEKVRHLVVVEEI